MAEPKTEGSKVPWSGWAHPKADVAGGEQRRQRLTKSYWSDVGSKQKGEAQPSEWIDLDELLEGFK